MQTALTLNIWSASPSTQISHSDTKLITVYIIRCWGPYLCNLTQCDSTRQFKKNIVQFAQLLWAITLLSQSMYATLQSTDLSLNNWGWHMTACQVHCYFNFNKLQWGTESFSTLDFQICIYGLVAGKHCQNNMAVLSYWCYFFVSLMLPCIHAAQRSLRRIGTYLPAVIMKNYLLSGTQNWKKDAGTLIYIWPLFLKNWVRFWNVICRKATKEAPQRGLEKSNINFLVEEIGGHKVWIYLAVLFVAL